MIKVSQNQDQTRSAVLFLIFNRPDTTRQVFEQIRRARPSRLYIAADGPRPGRANEGELCQLAREVVNEVDWDCKVQTLFRENNQGCKNGVSSAIDWFFAHEEEGIILEDDCVPAKSFFNFCDTLLEKYRFDTRIRHISGCNLQMGRTWGDASYYFSNLTHSWGWASWRRVWKDYDKNIENYSDHEVFEQLRNVFDEPIIFESWLQILDGLNAGKIDSWAYPLTITNFFNNSLSIIPNSNLICNIGYRDDATHTKSTESIYANLPTCELNEITHPSIVVPQRGADSTTLNYDFNVIEKKRKHNLPAKKLKRWLKSFFVREQLVPEHSWS